MNKFINGNDLPQDIQNNITMLKQMRNPMREINQIKNMCNGRNPKDVFYALCQQRGVDPELILKQLK